MVAVLLTLLPPLLVGALAAQVCWPQARSVAWRGVLVVALGIGLALGLGSWTYFIWVVCIGPARPGFLATELVFSALLALALAAVWRRRARSKISASSHSPSPWQNKAIYAVFGLVMVAALTTLGLQQERHPHGEIDAWQFWNLHARLLARGDDHWQEPFARLDSWSHPDYPLLVSATVARSWICTGEESTRVPQLVAFLFAAATVGLLVAGLAILRTPAQGCLAGLVLVATPNFLRYAAAQYADVPLGFYFLAGVLLFEAHDRLAPETKRLPFLAGLVSGMAAWTKNEGMLFVVAMILARVVTALTSRRGFSLTAKELAAFAAGLAPFAAILVYFKLRVAGPNDLVGGQARGETLPRLLSGLRAWVVVSRMFLALFWVSHGIVAILAIYGFLFGRTHVPGRRGRHALTVLTVMVAGYALVYMVTPLDLEGHIALSVDRLYLQLWPCVLLLFFLNVAAPEEWHARGGATNKPR